MSIWNLLITVVGWDHYETGNYAFYNYCIDILCPQSHILCNLIAAYVVVVVVVVLLISRTLGRKLEKHWAENYPNVRVNW